MVNKKPFYKSKTFWINLVVIIFFGLLGIQVPISPNLEITALGILNIILRFATRTKIL